MRVLFLDDAESRHNYFRGQSIGHSVDHVWTAAEAIEALNTREPYDVACLDHDLEAAHYPGMAEAGIVATTPTGQAVADHIASMPEEKRPRRVIVHSFNPAGAVSMERALRGALRDGVLRIPFGQFSLGRD